MDGLVYILTWHIGGLVGIFFLSKTQKFGGRFVCCILYTAWICAGKAFCFCVLPGENEKGKHEIKKRKGKRSMASNILSVEIGSTEVRVAEMKEQKKGSVIRGHFRFPIRPGIVEDGYIKEPKELGEKLKEELASKVINANKVRFIVSSSRIASREVRIPQIRKNKIQAVVETNASEYFPIDPTEYVFSYRIMGVDEQGDAKNYRLMVYASPKSISESYRQLAMASGLEMTRLCYMGDSIFISAREEFIEGTHMLIKAEEDTMLVTVFKDGDLKLQRNINYGLNAAVETVQSFDVFGHGLSYQDALELMMKQNCVRRTLNPYSVIVEEEDTSEEMKAARTEVAQSLRYMVGNISRIMDYYISRNPGSTIDTISCCGIGGAVLGLVKLLSHELDQSVNVLNEVKRHGFAEDDSNAIPIYLALFGVEGDGPNLMEKVNRRGKKLNTQDLRGAMLVFVMGVVASVILIAVSLGNRIYQNKRQEALNEQIKQNQSAQAVYDKYKKTKEKYELFGQMYEYTNTPNESLLSFLEELQEKMPKHMTIDSLSSTGTEVSISAKMANKAEAANALIQLRSFESFSSVRTTGITEDEGGTVTMSITATYATPAALSNSNSEGQ